MRPTILVAGLILAGLFVGGAPAADAPKVIDDAGMFSPEAIKKANATLAALDKAGTPLHVVTIAKLPKDRQEEYDQLAKDEKKLRGFWGKWTRRDALAAKATGVYLQICKSPGHVHFVIDNKTQDSGKFGNDDGEELVKILTGKFKEAKGKSGADAVALRDAALAEAVQFVQDTVKGIKKTKTK